MQLNSWKTHLLLLLTAIVSISIFSQSSPLYPFNEWCDANCYFNIGIGITQGKVPYVELFDHKGPLLFFIQALAALISSTSFFGVYVVEIAWLYATLFLVWRILNEVLRSKYSLFIAIITGFLLTSCIAFASGSSAEEYCLPFLLGGMFLGARKVYAGVPFRKRELYLIGLCTGVVLWTKFTILGMYVGFYLYFLIIFWKEKRWKELQQFCLFTLAGVATISALLVGYALATNSLPEMLNGYFYQCIFGYRKVDDKLWYETIMRMMYNVFSSFWRNYFVVLALGFILILVRKTSLRKALIVAVVAFVIACLPLSVTAQPLNERIFIAAVLFGQILIGWLFYDYIKTSYRHSFWICIGLTTYIFVFYSTYKIQLYYSIPLILFTPIGLHALFQSAQRKKGGVVLVMLLSIGLFALSAMRNRNFRRFLRSDQQYVEGCFGQIIKAKGQPESSLLVYKVKDTGYYLNAGKIWPCRFGDATVQVLQKELKAMQDSMVENHLVNFVITGEHLSSPYYELVDSGQTGMLETDREFFEPRYLYQRK